MYFLLFYLFSSDFWDTMLLEYVFIPFILNLKEKHKIIKGGGIFWLDGVF